jgi:hypothetical protein
MENILQRLQIIKLLISLNEDYSEHLKQLENLKQSDITNIVDLLKRKSYSSAIESIDQFSQRYSQVEIYKDPQIDLLKRELDDLILALEEQTLEKDELNKLVSNFEADYQNKLGGILRGILRLRKLKAQTEFNETPNQKTEKAYKEAEKEFENFEQDYEQREKQSKNKLELSPEQENELKSSFRKASKLTHPDAVSDEFKEQAKKCFQDLNDAYQNNDLKLVQEILNNLDKGIFTKKSEKINEIDKLKIEINLIKLKTTEIERQLTEIKNSETYILLQSLDWNWRNYLEEQRKLLENDLLELEKA